eukprot:scaffold463_cov242-Pinguiococcus_pyrenoidosus.AAC.18
MRFQSRTPPCADVDWFQAQKEAGLAAAQSTIESLSLRLLGSVGAMGRPAGSPAPSITAAAKVLRLWSLTSLWGNKLDLSLWPAPTDAEAAADAEQGAQEDMESGEKRLQEVLLSGEERLLGDDFDECFDDLSQEVATSGDTGDGALFSSFGIVTDNAGLELATDMMLAHCIVAFGLAKSVTLHCKEYPVFVSDATENDVRHTVDYFSKSPDPSMATLGQVWSQWIDAGRLKIEPHSFWCHPKPMWEMPRPVAERLHQHRLVVVKGDANYRRLLGDRPWPLDTNFDSVCGYFPTRLLALRALKAEVGLGLSETAQTRAKAADDKWLTSGRFGVVQYSSGQTAGWAMGAGALDDPMAYLS